jgi:hypothetical protein
VRDVRASVDHAALAPVARCAEQQAAGWYLGDVLPEEPKRLSFPFRLRPRPTVQHVVFEAP